MVRGHAHNKKEPLCTRRRKRSTIIGVDESKRIYELQRGKAAQTPRKKNAGHKALLVLDKQIKINMCRTKERRQQNEC